MHSAPITQQSNRRSESSLKVELFGHGKPIHPSHFRHIFFYSKGRTTLWVDGKLAHGNEISYSHQVNENSDAFGHSVNSLSLGGTHI